MLSILRKGGMGCKIKEPKVGAHKMHFEDFTFHQGPVLGTGIVCCCSH